MIDREQIERRGVAAVQLKFTEMDWIFREQPTSDFGIDAQAEEKQDGQATGRLIALQIKTGKSYFRRRGANYVFYGSERHLSYWTSHSLPVFLILHDPESDLTLWQRIDPQRVDVADDGSWSLEIPPQNVLGPAATPFLARGLTSDPASIRRLRLALDLPLIEQVAAWLEEGPVFLRVDEWVNKSLNFRDARFTPKDPSGEAEIWLSLWKPASDINDYMHFFFPWLEYEYAEELEPDPPELQAHTLEVKLNELAANFLAVETYYRDGSEPLDIEGEYETTDDPYYSYDDEEPFDEAGFRDAVERDSS